MVAPSIAIGVISIVLILAIVLLMWQDRDGGDGGMFIAAMGLIFILIIVIFGFFDYIGGSA